MEIITEDDGVNLYFHDCDGRLREIFKLENKHFVRIKSDTNIGTVGKCREFLNKLIDNVMEFSYI